MTKTELLAHGISGRADLPLSLALVSYSAGAILVITFAALAWLWPSPRWQQPGKGVAFPRGVDRLLKIIAWPARATFVALFAISLYAAWTVDAGARNIAPFAVYVILWTGFLLGSGVIGDLWRGIGPIPAIGRLIARERKEYRFGHWPAAGGLFAFTWLELVYSDPASARALAVALSVYLAITVVGCVLWGRVWLREGDPFGALFRLIAYMAPFYVDEAKRLQARPPLVGLTSMPVGPGTVALVVTALGSTTYDGLSRTQLWTGFVGEPNLVTGTGGLLWTIGAVYALYRVAVTAIPALAGVPKDEYDPDETAAAFVHSLIPIAFAYAVAHYFSLLVFEGQTAIAVASDPLARGWDLFGTRSWEPAFSALSPRAIANVQTISIVLGHVAGVVLAHDRAVARYPVKVATRTQYPLLAVMVAYTVGALLILLGG